MAVELSSCQEPRTHTLRVPPPAPPPSPFKSGNIDNISWMPNATFDSSLIAAQSEEGWQVNSPMIVLLSALSVVGVVGNLLVITVVFNVRGMKTPTNCYLVSLALSDTLFFFGAIPHEIMYNMMGEWDDYLFGAVGCALLTMLPYLAMNTSSLSITAFTVERFIGICYPYRARTMCTVSRAKLIITVMWTMSILYHSQWLFLATLVREPLDHNFTITTCTFSFERNDTMYKVIFLADFLGLYVIPMLLDVVIYVKIGLTLSQCSDKIKNSVKSKVTKSEDFLLASRNGSENLCRESHVSFSEL
ncbi:unnamed protein product [Caenorhabditis auriculariae]|uniref:Thyrotropin-releasing hormone receptor n=1 Tax=Caenorhabditis auriculariae TaxID=2777116 RepID=A0A8S1GMQ7_9PELO|nr:unnamed protein product [Caenorhabditis auriculariae]